MKKLTVVILAVLMFVGIAYAETQDTKDWQSDVSKKTAGAVTDTAESAVDNTANIAQTSVTDTGSTPATAIDAVKDTGDTALKGADKALKTLTGNDER